MKFEMEQYILAEMAGKAKRIASDSLPVEILRGVYLECSEDGQELSMIATDATLSIFLKGAAKVAERGRIVLNARLLFDIISHAPGGIVSFCTNDAQGVVEIRSGQSAYEIPFLSAKDYPKPEMPFPEDTVRLRGIRSLAMKTAFAVHENSASAALGCICLRTQKGRVQAAASNGFCVMLTKQSVECEGGKEFLLPKKPFLKFAAMTQDEEEYSVGAIRNRVVFMRRGMLLSMETFCGVTFLDTDRAIRSVTPQYTAVIEAEDMKRALELMSVGGKTLTVNISLNGESVAVQCGRDSPAKTEISAKVSEETPEGGFYYALKELIYLFRVIDGIAQIKMDGNGTMLIRSRDELFLQLPKQAGTQAKKTQKKSAMKKVA